MAIARWTQRALDDLDAIAAFIARDAIIHARRVVHELLDLADKVAEFPEMGRLLPEMGNPAIRESFLYSYRLIYRVRGGAVEVLAVIHGSRLLDVEKVLQ